MSALNISSFIWGIADDVLRDVYVRGKYRDVILPMTVIRRLDAVLEPTKDDVLRMKEQLDQAGITNQDAAIGRTRHQITLFNKYRTGITADVVTWRLDVRQASEKLETDAGEHLDHD